ncbi:heavy-metal-associated domain-containing protein [Candidatus Woesearchaeota archaeon]|nr:heavy-metal-associated domain-containing protein [Candidatus Woesearchaeota archaeon]
MNNRIYFIMIFAALSIFVFAGCSRGTTGQAIHENIQDVQNTNGASHEQRVPTTTELSSTVIHHLVLKVEGMYCQACPLGLHKMLLQAPAILDAKVSYQTKSAEVLYDSAKISKEKIAAMFTSPYTASVVDDMAVDAAMYQDIKANFVQ